MLGSDLRHRQAADNHSGCARTGRFGSFLGCAGAHALGFLLLALFANSLRCNGASAVEGRPSVALLASSRQPVTRC